MTVPTAYFSSDFDDPHHRWRRLFAECLGTFSLVLIAAGGEVTRQALGSPSKTAIAVATGLLVATMVYTLGEVSGAHTNPAITFGFAIRRDFPWGQTVGYVGAQILGAILAAALLRAAFGTGTDLGVTQPGADVSLVVALDTEILFTALLVTVVIGMASSAKLVGPNTGIVVGSFIAVATLVAGPVSGASMNPARSLGPAIASGSYDVVWIW